MNSRPMSNIDKQALRERYSAKPTPKCDICGAKMTIQRMSGSRVTYGCSGAIYDETGCHYAEGRSLADDHYEQSRVTVTDESDPDVLALLDELEAKDKSIILLKDQLAQLANFNPDWDVLKATTDSLRELMDELTTARTRIAELEAREVKLPTPYDINVAGERIEHKLGDHFDSDGVVAAICAAGIRINGEG